MESSSKSTRPKRVIGAVIWPARAWAKPMTRALDVEGIEQSWGWLQVCQRSAFLGGLPRIDHADGTIDLEATAGAIRRYADTEFTAGRLALEIHDMNSTITADEVKLLSHEVGVSVARRPRPWRWLAVASLVTPFVVVLCDSAGFSHTISACCFFSILAVFFWLRAMSETVDKSLVHRHTPPPLRASDEAVGRAEAAPSSARA